MSVHNSQPYVNDGAIKWLASLIENDEKDVSSLWKGQTSDFSYENGKFSGLTGFGSYTPRVGWLKRVAHYLLQMPYRLVGNRYTSFGKMERIARDVAAKQGRNYEFDIMRQALLLSFLEKQIGDVLKKPDNIIVVIGDGFATLSAMLLKAYPHSRVVMINLTKVLLVDVVYLKKILPDVNVAAVHDEPSLSAALADINIRAMACRADDRALLGLLPSDLVIDYVSMAEMKEEVVSHYFELIRQSGGQQPLFYCCNREEKEFSDGTITRFENYPWDDRDDIIVDELCPWNQSRYTTHPPFYMPYQGSIRHRLARMAALER